MASAIVFLVYACGFLPLLAAWKESPCAFPFYYQGTVYNSCIGDETKDGKLWCATTHNYDDGGEWKWCATQEYGGNSGGKSCVFPFTYQGKTYYTCTNKNSHKSWCATTGSYDKNRIWSYCADTRPTGDPCHFPFVYKNTSHTTCITDDSPQGEPWCAVTKNYDDDHERVFCKASDPRPCVFPFIFHGKSYCSCTRDGTIDGQLWCATTPNYDRKRKWRNCILQAYGGNANGKGCNFSFTYKEKTYSNCTSVDEPSGRQWCATTPSYDKHGEWAFCADAGPSREGTNRNKTCTFPFKYKGNIYYTCTKDGSHWGRSWCSLTSNYDIDPKWMYCPFSGSPGEETNHNKTCTFPFKYKGNIYYTCTKDGSHWGRSWCSLTSNYEVDPKWMYCPFSGSPGEETNQNKTCTFPFKYKGIIYTSCTKDGSHSGRFWCSLTSNYDVDPKWMYCPLSDRESGCSQQL